jgi:hypothetical protein
MSAPDRTDRDITEAIRTDLRERKLARLLQPTDRQEREMRRVNKAWLFEHGDHQPDGTVKPSAD